jgi:hypothetical protein
VGQGRVELPTSRLSGVRSNHLSYWPWRPSVARVAQLEVTRQSRRVTSRASDPVGPSKLSPINSEHGNSLL